MNETMKPTVDVLRELGVTYWAMNAALRAGHFPKPKTKVATSYVWTTDEMEAARTYFANPNPKRKPGPKPKKGAA